MDATLYNSLADLLSYPEQQVDMTLAAIENRQSAIGNEVASFGSAVAGMDVRALQELFIQTFDLSPMCSLEMGWHLFCENYDRGLLLVKIRQLLRGHGVEEGAELPDHITYALRLVPRMEAVEAEYFVEAVVLPALQKMLAALHGKNNPYERVLLAANQLLAGDFPNIQINRAARGAALRVLA